LLVAVPVGVFVVGGGAAQGAIYTWDGGGVGGTDIGTAVNWSSDTLPSVSLGDTGQWDGTVAGPLSLVYSNSAFAGAAGNPGINLNITATQTDSLNIDSGVNTSSFRLNNITIAAGAGAFSLGDAANTFNLTLGAPGTHTWTNNSSNTATTGSDVMIGLGGGGNHTLDLAGSGGWTFNNAVTNGGGALTVTKSGTGNMLLAGAGNNFTTLNVNNATGNVDIGANGMTIANGGGSILQSSTGGTINATGGGKITLGSNGGDIGSAAGTTLTINAVIQNGAGTAVDIFSAGAGITALTAANTYTGATNIQAGTLQLGAGGATGSLSTSSAISMSANTTLAFNRSNAITQGTDFSGAAITGSTGIFTQLGTGTLTLTAANAIRTLNVNNVTGVVDVGSSNLSINNSGGTTIASTTGGTINGTGGGSITLARNNATDGPDIGTANGTTLTINAKITGTSSYESWHTANGTGVTVLTGQNDYTNATIINSGVLSVSNIGNTGSTTSNLGQNSTINLSTSASGSQNSTLRYAGTGETTNRVVNFFLNGTNTGGIIEQSGTGLLKFTSNMTVTGTGSKTLTLQGSTAGTGEFAGNIVNGSSTVSLTKVGTGTWTLSGANTYTGGTRANEGTLILSGSHTHSGGDFISVNNVGAQNAVLKITSGAGTQAYNDINLAEGTNARGAIYQSGGDFSAAGGIGVKVGSGTTSYGYYSLSDGTLTNSGATDLQVGGGSGATGVMDVSGGSVTTASWIVLGRNGAGNGLLNVTGGSVTSNSNNIALNWANTAGSISILNVGGGSGAATVTGVSNAANYLDVSQSGTAGTTGVVNVLANGTLTVAQVRVSGAASTAHFNFNGGTLKATALNAGGSFMTDGDMDAVRIYSGGATIDDNGTAITISNALLAPTNNGVSSIAVGGAGSGYIGAPLVTITGGTGSGATAVANMVDDGTGNGTFKVGSITITSPGVYTVAPTTVTYNGGGPTSAATSASGDITTAANTSGGLTKTGAGTLTLTASNTYTGGTTINQGTLITATSGAPSAGALGTGAVTVNSGATLQSNTADSFGFFAGAPSVLNIVGGTVTTGAGAFRTTLPSLSMTGGTVTNGANTGDASGVFSWNAGATITVNSFPSTATISATSIGMQDVHTFTVADGLAATDLLVSSNLQNVTYAPPTPGGVTKEGAGLMEMTGANSYTGTTTVNDGILQITGSASNTTTGNTVVNHGELQLGKTGGAFYTSSSVLQIGNGSGAAGSASVKLLAANQTSPSGIDVTIFSDGLLNLNGFDESINQLLDDLSGGSIVDGGSGSPTLTVGAGDFRGVIQDTAGNLALTKNTAGLLRLRHINNTYSGNTTVSAGTLALDNSGSSNNIASSPVITVASGAVLNVSGLAGTTDLVLASGQTLQGSGTVTGNLTVGSGAVISPGNSPGTMSNNGSEIWGDGGNFLFEINDVNAGAGTDPGWDLLNITGSLDISGLTAGGFDILVTSLTLGNSPGLVHDFVATQSYDWLFLDAGSTINAFASNKFNVDTSAFANNFTAGYWIPGAFSVVRGDSVSGGNDSQLYLHFQAAIVPEPSTWILALLGLGGLGVIASRKAIRKHS